MIDEAIVKLKDIAWRTDDDVTFRAINAVIDKLQVKPEPTKFTKKFRELIELSKEHLSNNKIGRLQTYGKEACDIIEQQAEQEKWDMDTIGQLDRKNKQLQSHIDKLAEGQQAKIKAGS